MKKHLKIVSKCAKCNKITDMGRLVVSYVGNVDINSLTREVKEFLKDKSKRCKKCNSRHYTEISYSFYHEEKIK